MLGPHDVTVDREFHEIIPPLSPAEREQLEINILADGCHDPLVVWDGVILDGHNRYEICVEHGLAFQTVELRMADRDTAKAWIIANQFGRRNLTTFQRAELALKLESYFGAAAKERQGARTDLPDFGKTREKIAHIAGVSEDTIRKSKILRDEADEETKDKLRRGEISLNAAFRDHRAGNGVSDGKSLVNGHHAPDPPDVARARAEGRIAPEVVVEVVEPEPEPASRLAKPAPEPAEADLDDEAWLDTLPLRSVLVGACLRIFERDALCYRTLEDARRTFLHHASRAIATARRKGSAGEYTYRVSVFLKLNHPRHWHRCPAPEDGGCGGSGTIGVVGECPRCRGRGYWI